jgi:hypothetical protein
MNDMTNFEQNTDTINELAIGLIDIFSQLPAGFKMFFFGSCLAIMAYAIHKDYGIFETDSGLQITNHSITA